MVMHRGGCHCGRVAFTVEGPEELDVSECNCSICRMTGHLHYIVPRNRFRLLRGGDDLASYRFNTGTAEHLFCRVCGVKSFYVPRSHPEGISVNARCLDSAMLAGMRVRAFDGEHWEEHAAELPPLGEGGLGGAARSIAAAALLVTLLAACAPEVGSERWCEAMRDKPRGDWTANEALDFARHCLIPNEEG